MAALFINGYYGFWPWFFGGSILWGIIGLVIASTKGRSGWGCCLGCLLGPFGLLLTMLMHAAVNNTKDIVPSAVAGATNPFALSTSLVAWLTVALLWIGALFFLRTMPSARFAAAAPDAAPRAA